MPDPDHQDAEYARFPVLDPEPPARPSLWRLAIGSGVLVTAAAIAAAIVFWPSASGSRPVTAPPVSLPAGQDHGRIVAERTDGSLALANPDGTHVTALPALGAVQGVSAAPDDRYLSEGTGQVISISSGPRLAWYRSNVQLSRTIAAAGPDSFADHDQDLILLNSSEQPGVVAAQNPVWAVSVASGAEMPLGTADAAAGDPQSAGAYVSVAGPPVASAVSTQASPDADVELRTAGQPPVVLATAAAISSDLGVVSEPVVLVPLPDPAGDKIAVVVLPAADGASGGIVVLNRAGQMLGTTGPREGLTSYPTWSPSGSALAWVGLGAAVGKGGLVSSQHVLVLWSISGRPARILYPSAAGAPNPRVTGGFCVWSPDGRAVLCSSPTPAGQYQWAVSSASGASVRVLPGPGRAVAWLAGEARG